MKITYFCVKAFLVGALFCAALTACAGKPPPVAAQPLPAAPADELDAAIRETSDYLNKQLPKGNKLMILNVQSEFPALSEYIIDELIANTVNDRVFSVVDRQQLNTIRAELDFQTSGEVDDTTAQALGRMAGAQIIISGAVSQLGDLHRLRVRALSVQTAQIEGQFNRNIPEGSTISALVRSRATGYGGGAVQPAPARETAAASVPMAAVAPVPVTAAVPEPAQVPVAAAVPEPAQVPAAPPAPTTYNIGDTGPGGGKIFYVSEAGFTLTTDSSICHYLEAAPVDLGGIRWATSRYNGARMATEEEAIGTGKRNTDVILETDISAPAAEACKEYRGGGKSDWFLPSLGELAQLFKNRKHVGGLGTSNYWSSTQAQRSGYQDNAWCLNFSNGDQVVQGKGNTFAVRAIRAF
ncbi:MAG: DUF1566 domain-containing protein [Treponema sp.]|jgi:hypothetical protein|nr:DUF1566 domain-containing protein [Treponema sp.]